MADWKLPSLRVISLIDRLLGRIDALPCPCNRSKLYCGEMPQMDHFHITCLVCGRYVIEKTKYLAIEVWNNVIKKDLSK